MILIVFLISVAVFEAILWKDRKPSDHPIAKRLPEDTTQDLLQLAGAIRREGPDADLGIEASIAEYNRENAGVK